MAESLDIGFADLLEVLTTVFGVPEDGRKALTSRLKHLQSKSFPPGVNVGRGGRVRYNIEAVMGTVLVLTLTSAFIPPNQAVELVRGNWTEWVVLLRQAARSELDAGMAGKMLADAVVVIESNALSELGGATPAEGRAAGSRGTLSFRTVGLAQITAGGRGSLGAVTVVDVAAILDRAASAIASAVGDERKAVLDALLGS